MILKFIKFLRVSKSKKSNLQLQTYGVTDVYKIERDTETNQYTLKYCVKVGEEEKIWEVSDKNLEKPYEI